MGVYEGRKYHAAQKIVRELVCDQIASDQSSMLSNYLVCLECCIRNVAAILGCLKYGESGV